MIITNKWFFKIQHDARLFYKKTNEITSKGEKNGK